MAISTDVNLPRVHIPQYPQRCVRCGADPQGKTIKIWTHTIGWWTYLLWAFGKVSQRIHLRAAHVLGEFECSEWVGTQYLC